VEHLCTRPQQLRRDEFLNIGQESSILLGHMDMVARMTGVKVTD
jgi:hypothetical protein